MSAGLYVPLQANFFGDDKVVLCSPLAKLVYLQGLCIAKLMGTDGIVTRAQLKRECDRSNTSTGTLPSSSASDFGLK